MIDVGVMIRAGISGLIGISGGKAGQVGLQRVFFLNGIVTSLSGLVLPMLN
jgi:hypothetical protein